MGTANRIRITDLDTDDTIDVRVTYTEIVGLYQSSDPVHAELADMYLSHASEA